MCLILTGGVHPPRDVASARCHSGTEGLPRRWLCAKRREIVEESLLDVSPGNAPTPASCGVRELAPPFADRARPGVLLSPTYRAHRAKPRRTTAVAPQQGRERTPALDATPRPPSRRRTGPPRPRPRRRPRLAPPTNRQTLRPPPRIPRLAPRQHLDPLLQKIENQWLVTSG